MENEVTRPEKAFLRQKRGDEESQIHGVAQIADSGATSASRAQASAPATNRANTAAVVAPRADTNERIVSEAAATQQSQERDQLPPQTIFDFSYAVQSLQSLWAIGSSKVIRVFKGEGDQQDLPQELDESKFNSCMFLITGNRFGSQRMVVVPVDRGHTLPRLEPLGTRKRTNNVQVKNRIEPRQEHEGEEKVYKRMHYKWREYLRGWLQHAPCYVIKDIRETNFYFERIPHRGDKLYRVISTPLKDKQILGLLEEERSIANRDPVILNEDMELELDPECAEAREKVQSIEQLHHLKEFFQDPSKAVGGKTLEGVAQKTCIYGSRTIPLPEQNKLPEHNEYVRGLHITMGWDFELTQTRLSVIIAALVCLILLIRFVSGDWNLALQFGSVLATVAFGAPLAQFFVQDRERLG